MCKKPGSLVPGLALEMVNDGLVNLSSIKLFSFQFTSLYSYRNPSSLAPLSSVSSSRLPLSLLPSHHTLPRFVFLVFLMQACRSQNFRHKVLICLLMRKKDANLFEMWKLR